VAVTVSVGDGVNVVVTVGNGDGVSVRMLVIVGVPEGEATSGTSLGATTGAAVDGD